MVRAKWVVGNWKQNHLLEAAESCAGTVAAGLPEALGSSQVHVGIAPGYMALFTCAQWCRPTTPMWLFAQDSAAQESGSFTGEVGPQMLTEAKVTGVIVGHSERRQLLGESSELVAAKLSCGLRAGLTAILCVGEPLEVRHSKKHEKFVISQLSQSISKLEHELINERFVVAYEPVWAIGTGHNATVEQANDMHRCIRGFLRERFGVDGADRSILYGGSVKPTNAAALAAGSDIDGFLVGGASLDPRSFLDIVRAQAAD